MEPALIIGIALAAVVALIVGVIAAHIYYTVKNIRHLNYMSETLLQACEVMQRAHDRVENSRRLNEDSRALMHQLDQSVNELRRTLAPGQRVAAARSEQAREREKTL